MHKKNIYLLLSIYLTFLTLFSCQTPTSWVLSTINNSDQHYCSSKLRHKRSSDITGIELELQSMDDQISAFLNIYLNKITPSENDPLKSSVIFYMDGIKYEDQVDRLKGGQRLRLSSDRTRWLVDHLRDGKTIDIQIDGYSQHIDSLHFSELYEKFAENQTTWNIFEGLQTLIRGPL